MYTDKLESSGDVELLLETQKLPESPRSAEGLLLTELTSALETALDNMAQLRSDRAVLAALALLWVPKELLPKVLPANGEPTLLAVESAAVKAIELGEEGSDPNSFLTLLSYAREAIARIEAEEDAARTLES